MKIAYILPSLANKGPILVVKDIVLFLNEIADITVFYFDPIEEVQFECETVKISFFDKIDFSAFDIVHSHMLRPDAFTFLNRNKIKGKCVSTLHSYVEMDLKNTHNGVVSYVFTKIWNQLLRRHNVLVALSSHMRNYYKGLYSNSNITYVYNGRNIDGKSAMSIPTEDQLTIQAFKGDSTLLGVSALLTDIKGIDQTIRLLALMPDLKLLLIGDGPSKEALIELATTLGVHNRCLFLGYRKDGHRYYSFFDIYAMTSHSEGFPLAIIEAAAYGLPTLASAIPITLEAFTKDEVSFYELNNIKSMQQAVHQLLDKKELFSKNISAKYQKAYTAQKMAQDYYTLYEQLK